ncbi:MAG: MBL fold metallo-hydrolase [Verrucomicrobiales bacterium]
MTLPLEDNYEDILGKAMRGLGVTPEELAGRATLDREQIAAQLRGDFSPQAALALAPHLHLDADTLVASGQQAWYPDVPIVPGIRQFTSNWKSMTVNAYAAWDDNGDAAIFDTGADIAALLKAASVHPMRVQAICITHCHADHVARLGSLREAFPKATVYASRREPIEWAILLEEGDDLVAGDLRIEARLTWGHSPGGLTYVVRGLGRLVAVVGDALFAGSMGGGSVSWSDALDTNRKQIFTLPDETAICPGHGPMTTVAQEKEHNPFYPEFKS